MLRPQIIKRSFTTTSILNLPKKTLIQRLRTTPANEFDLGLFQSTLHYFKWLISTREAALKPYQDSILSSLNKSSEIQIYTQKTAGLNEIVVKNPKAQDIKIPTLFIHGHAASGLCYHRNFEGLGTNFKELYAIDLPDVGLSDRKMMKKVKNKSKDVKYEVEKIGNELKYKVIRDLKGDKEKIKEVENYYIDSFEKWRKDHGFDKINIVAHSFGGYLSFKYCLKYPGNVAKLCLISPGGVERNILSIHNKNMEGIVSNDTSSPHFFRRSLLSPAVFKKGFTILKMLGPIGMRLISKYFSLRFSRGLIQRDFNGNEQSKPINETNNKDIERKIQVKTFIKYTMNLLFQKTNSYNLFNYLFHSNILAYSPILDNLENFKTPVLFMYGQHDWMDQNSGLTAVTSLCGAKGDKAKFSVVERAGHNVFLDNPEDFNREVVNFLKGSNKGDDRRDGNVKKQKLS